jgi:hypothetical protein
MHSRSSHSGELACHVARVGYAVVRLSGKLEARRCCNQTRDRADDTGLLERGKRSEQGLDAL